jgi:hypothetical protein
MSSSTPKLAVSVHKINLATLRQDKTLGYTEVWAKLESRLARLGKTPRKSKAKKPILEPLTPAEAGGHEFGFLIWPEDLIELLEKTVPPRFMEQLTTKLVRIVPQ